MRRTHLITFLLLLTTIGCERKPADQAAAYVAAWPATAQNGGRLPTDQVPFFEKHLDEATPVLRAALGDGDPTIRRHATYVIGEIGQAAVRFEPDLRSRVAAEPDRTVRMYLYDALASIGGREPETLAALQRQFATPAAAAEADGESYQPVDERIALAGTLYALSNDPESRVEYEAFVVRHLAEDAEGASGESRWMAITTLAGMRGANSAKVPLEALLAAPGQPAWVGPKVRAALRGINGG